MSAQPAPFAHIHQTSFNVEAIDRRAISHIASLQGSQAAVKTSASRVRSVPDTAVGVVAGTCRLAPRPAKTSKPDTAWKKVGHGAGRKMRIILD